MATYQIINLETGEFSAVSLEKAAAIAQLDPHEIEWAIEEHGVCETDAFQITKLNDGPEGNGKHERAEGDADDAGDGDSITALPVFVYITQEEFEAHLAESPAAVIRLGWDEPIVREAVEVDREGVTARLRGNESGEGDRKPSAVFHLTRESIALISLRPAV